MKNILLISKVIDICTPYIGYSDVDKYFHHIESIASIVGEILEVNDIDISDSVSYLRALYSVSSISELKLSNIEIVEKKFYIELTKLDNLVTPYDEETFMFNLYENKLKGDRLATRLYIYLEISTSSDINNNIKLLNNVNYSKDLFLIKTRNYFVKDKNINKGRMGF